MISEKEMTDAQKKKREEIVLSLKKNMAGFKKRYGKRAKEVMYATATKMATREDVNEKRGRPRKDGTSDGDLENIQMQLRKSVSLRGKKDVEFADGKKKKVNDKVARKVLQMIDKYRQSKDKQNIVNFISKSEKNLMSFASGKVKDSDMDPEAKRKKLLGIK